MYGLMGSVNEWINETKGLMKEYNEDMPLEDQENLKKRAEVKLSQLKAIFLANALACELGQPPLHFAFCAP